MALHDFFRYFGELAVCRVRGCFGGSLHAKTAATVWTDTRVQLAMRDLGNHKNERFPAMAVTVTRMMSVVVLLCWMGLWVMPCTCCFSRTVWELWGRAIILIICRFTR